MKKNFGWLTGAVLGAALMVGCVAYAPYYPTAEYAPTAEVIPQAPPAPPYEGPFLAAHPGYDEVWVPGHWKRTRHGDRWVPGHWKVLRYSRAWVPEPSWR